VFQLLREVGNSLCLLKDLSAALELGDVLARVRLGGLLGPSAATQSHLASRCLAPAEPLQCPAEAVLTALSEASFSGPPWVRCSATLSRLPAAVSGLLEPSPSMSPAIRGRSLFGWAVAQLEEFLYLQQLGRDWEGGLCEVWSALQFLFCLPDSGPSSSHSGDSHLSGDSASMHSIDGTGSVISNEAEFGHGFAMAGCALLHLLGQRAALELRDLSGLVLRTHSQDELRRLTDMQQAPFLAANNTPPPEAAEGPAHRDCAAFLEQARSQLRLQGELFYFLEMAYRPRGSYQSTLASKRYHPPRED